MSSNQLLKYYAAISNGIEKDNFYIEEGTILDDFNSLDDWTISNVNSASIDTSIFKNSKDSIRIQTNNTAIFSTLRKAVSLDFEGISPTFETWLYLADQTTVDQFDILSIRMYKDLGNFFFLNQKLDFKLGWNRMFINSDDWDINGNITWSDEITIVGIEIRMKSGFVGNINLDQIRCNSDIQPNVIITFDDAWESQYTEAFSYMQSKGMKGSIYTPGTLIDTANYMTLDQVKEIHAAGWNIANHSYTETRLDTLTQQEVEDELQANINYLLQNNIGGAEYYLAYPGGGYNNTVIQGAKNVGIKMGRTTKSGLTNTIFDFSKNEIYEMECRPYQSTGVTVSGTKTVIGRAIKNRSTVIIVYHRIVDTVVFPEDKTPADFQEVIDYIESTGVNVITLSQFYSRLKNVSP